jgi:hypothetical protein
MAKPIIIKHKASGLIKKGCYGFSWTYLIFGWFVPVFRGELMVGALHFVFTFLSLGLWQLIFSFLYNKQYMTRMVQSGWELADTEARNAKARAVLQITD